MVYIKTKKVQLKNGRIQEYYYLAKTVRINGQPKPIIIKYLGKEKTKSKVYSGQ